MPPARCPTDDERLQDLKARALSISDVDELTMKLLAAKYTTHPELALLYFHCCATNPDARVYNNERLSGSRVSESVRVVERLRTALDRAPDVDEIARCQASSVANDPRRADIRFCASCCELLESSSDVIHCTSVRNLPESFRVTPTEHADRYGRLAPGVLAAHAQVWRSERGELYYLNPDLVGDPAAIELCGKCVSDPRAYAYSIASGHDYGRHGALPALNEVEHSCVAPVRRFGLELSLSGQHSTGHVICFPTDGPVQCSRTVPNVDEGFRVTFVGSHEQWRAQKRRFRKMYRIRTDGVFQWLHVLAQMHSYYVDNNVDVDLGAGSSDKLVELQRQIDANIVVDDTEAVRRMSEAKMGDRFDDDVREAGGDSDSDDNDGGGDGDDDDGGCIVSERSAVLKPTWVDVGSGAGIELVNAVATALELHGARVTGSNEGGEDDGTSSDPVVPITRDRRPLCEWDENGLLLAGAFPMLFMRGGSCLPSGTAPKALVRHWMRYYDGRFEKNVMLVTVLFNQMQRHAAVQ